MTGSVTKAMPIQFINSKRRIKKQRGRKTALFGYYVCLSHDLLLMALKPDTHTYTHTYTNVHGQNDFKKPGMCGLQACAGCRPARAWFKKLEIKKVWKQVKEGAQ